MPNNIDRLIKLNWAGPFAYGPRGIEPSNIDSHATKSELNNYLGKPGIYAESLLIHAHSPAYHSKNITSINIAPPIQMMIFCKEYTNYFNHEYLKLSA